MISVSRVSGLDEDGGGEISSLPSSVVGFSSAARGTSSRTTTPRRLCRFSSVWVAASAALRAVSAVSSVL